MYKLLPKEYKRDLEFEKVLTITIQAIHTSRFIALTKNNDAFLLPERLNHLKRIKKQEPGQSIALLCLPEVSSSNKRKKKLLLNT